MTEELDVLIVGAGLSGIDAAYRLQTGSPDRSFAVFEARDAIGGTWDLFRYPGVRSDSDMATLGFPFRPWRGEKSIAGGADIRRYIEDTAHSLEIDKKIRLGHRVVSAHWSSALSRWTVNYETGGSAGSLTCAFLFMCAGYYDYAQGHAPSWDGMSNFRGTVIHPQFWPDGADVQGKRVVVIGSGATAVTLIPALVAKDVAHVTMLQRSPTYVVAAPSRDRRAEKLRRMLPPRLADFAIRWKNIGLTLFFYNLARRNPEKMKQLIRAGQRRALGPDFPMEGHFTPRYNPWDQRLCLVPDGDLFDALRRGRASIVTDEIKHFTEHGVQLKSGQRLPADIIVTATGLNIKLLGGAAIYVDEAAIDPSRLMLYKGTMLEGVPNLALAVGYTNASWTLKCDLSAQFVSRLLNYMARSEFTRVQPQAAGAASGKMPMLDLKSGYVERASALLPRQGTKAPWRIHQNYILDLVAFRLARIDDGVLKFGRQPGLAARAH